MNKDYTVSIANLENKKSGCATFEDLALIIDEQAKEGLVFCAFIPSVIGPSGKVLTYDLIFKEADCKKFEYKIEYILADNKKAGEATFSGYNSALLSNVSAGYELLGAIPTRMGPSGKATQIALIFIKNLD